MSIITWSDELSVGVEAFDSQHKRLVALINELHDAMSAGKGSTVLRKILSDLADYTVYHFRAEEAVLAKYEYPGYRSHRDDHDDLARQVLDFKDRFEAGKAVLSMELMKFLTEWLTNHILGADRDYTAFLNEKGVS